jgi:hypothetical protein
VQGVRDRPVTDFKFKFEFEVKSGQESDFGLKKKMSGRCGGVELAILMVAHTWSAP